MENYQNLSVKIRHVGGDQRIEFRPADGNKVRVVLVEYEDGSPILWETKGYIDPDQVPTVVNRASVVGPHWKFNHLIGG